MKLLEDDKRTTSAALLATPQQKADHTLTCYIRSSLVVALH